MVALSHDLLPAAVSAALAPLGWPWDGLPAQAAQSLAESLTRQFVAGPVYLLVDPLLGEPEGLPVDLERHPIPSDALGLAPEQAPFLVAFQSAYDPGLAHSLDWAAAEHLKACANGSGACSIGGWLQSYAPNTAVDLASQLGALLKAAGAPQGGRYLRLADRRVLALLHRAGAESARSEVPAIDWPAQLQGIAQWVYLDHHFTLQSLCGQAGPSARHALQLQPAHWQLLSQAEAINRSLMAWQCTHHPLPPDALAQLLPALVHARQRGLQAAQDQAAYAAEAVRYPAFEAWPRLDKIIALISSTQQAMDEVLEQLRHEWVDKPAGYWAATPTTSTTPNQRVL